MIRRCDFGLVILAASLAAPWPGPAQTLTVTKDDRTIRVAAPACPVAEYVYRESPLKPYLSKWYTPAGVQVLRDSPADHKHHHALMFAIGIDGVDFWGEIKGCGRQAYRQLEGPREYAIGGMPTAEFAERLDWLAADGKPLAAERRTISIVLGKDLPTRLLVWRTRLEAAPGRASVKLWGRDYFGLGARFVQSMDNKTRFVFPKGVKEESAKGHTLTQARWCACVGPADGKTITLAMFDHPANARHPARFFYMNKSFAYVSATLGLGQQPLELKAGQPLELCYGVGLWDGEAAAAQVEALYDRWLALSGGTREK